MFLIRLALLFVFVMFHHCAFSGPWFTGPLLARSGHTTPAGHHDLEPYFFYTDNKGVFARHWNLVQTHSRYNIQVNPLYSYGMNDWLDVQFQLPYVFRHVRSSPKYHHLSDSTVLLGFQLIEQHGWYPDFRLSVSETIPVGKYDLLNPFFDGADSTGLGSYQTTLGFNFQYLYHFWGEKYLRTRLVIDYNYASSVRVLGLNTYGGTLTTNGTVRPGKMANIDLAFEYTWTPHWALVMEGYVSHQSKTGFSGNVGKIRKSTTPIKRPAANQITLAPAIEYNWNEHVGLIAGEWFILTGQDTANFRSLVVALNIFW